MILGEISACYLITLTNLARQKDGKLSAGPDFQNPDVEKSLEINLKVDRRIL